MLPYTSSTCWTQLVLILLWTRPFMESNGRINWLAFLRQLIALPPRAVRNAVKRLTGTSLLNKQNPVSPDMLRKLMKASNLDNLLE